MQTNNCFDPHCRLCPRLNNFLSEVKHQFPAYHAAPVAPFGVEKPRLLVVGLAPGMHGANASGRPFTGDYAGLLLYKTLYRFGFSNQAHSESQQDGLQLYNCRITNAVKCLPPQNKPSGAEIKQCNPYLRAEFSQLTDNAVILALGGIAHQAVLRAYGMPLNKTKFAHNAVHRLLDGRVLIDSYHCSRYNINTRRLNAEMFADVFRNIESLMAG